VLISLSGGTECRVLTIVSLMVTPKGCNIECLVMCLVMCLVKCLVTYHNSKGYLNNKIMITERYTARSTVSKNSIISRRKKTMV